MQEKNVFDICDNILPHRFHTQFYYNYTLTNSYNIEVTDKMLENNKIWTLRHKLNEQSIKTLQLETLLKKSKFKKYLDKMYLQNAIINAIRPGETQYFHTHPSDVLNILYYVNPHWKREWGGETIFYDFYGKDPTHVVEYKPNRAVIFNGDIPHTARSPAIVSPEYRFTLVTSWKENG